MSKEKKKHGRNYSEAHRQKHIRKQAKKGDARWRRWYLLHPELAPESWSVNIRRLSVAKRLRYPNRKN